MRPGRTAGIEELVARALAEAGAARERPYYEAEADAAAREEYFAGIRLGDPGALFASLVVLLEETHVERPAYRPSLEVYPWVDLHPDGFLHSIYSGESFAPEDLIRADAGIARERVAAMEDLFARDATAGPRELEATFDALEAELPFNCEHVVPQSWFAKREPMRGDLHHLFACESRCNSFRGNAPYADFADRRAVRDDCGRVEQQGFEPQAGKGTVARATLYFLLRYPGQVGDVERELQRERLSLLLDWHATEPVAEYERHRNAAIAARQGNRNPVVDHPEWASEIHFRAAFAEPPSRS